MPKFKRGVTLVELLIVVAIVSILAAAVAVAINPAKRMGQARDSTRKAALSVMSRALLAYYLDRQSYPPPKPSDSTVKFVESDAPGDSWIPGLKPDYLKNLPKDPKQAALVSGLASIDNQNNGQVLGMADDKKGFYVKDTALLTDDVVTGQLSSTLDWVDLETSPGVYKFNKIDNAVAAAVAAVKPIRLNIGGGEASPAWLLAAPYSVPTYTFNTPNTGTHTAPYVWHPTYVARLNSFLTALGIYLQTTSYKSLIAGIYVPGGPLYTEMVTSGGSPAFNDAQNPSPAYIKSAYSSAWKSEIDAMMANFGNMPIISNLSQTWDESNSGGTPLNAWVATNVGDYAASTYSARIEFQNASVPDTFVDLVPYLSDKAKAGIAVSAQIGWFKLTDPTSDGGSAVTHDELNKAYQFAYCQLGARAIEVNNAAINNSGLKSVTATWVPALKGGDPPTGYECTPEFIPPALTCSPSSSSVAKDESVTLTASGGTIPYSWSATGGKPFETGTDPTFSVSFSAEGPHDVKVTDGVGSTTCVVTVTASGGGGGGGASDFKYRYFSDGLQTFELWAILEDKDDKEAYPNPARTCKKPQPLDNLNYNYCVAY